MVVEATGRFRARAQAVAHLAVGARKVVLTSPGKGPDATIVMGLNEDTYSVREHDVISNASCATNCAAPRVSVLHHGFGIQYGLLTTVHAYTGDQNLQDGPHKDLRRAWGAAGRRARRDLRPGRPQPAAVVCVDLPGFILTARRRSRRVSWDRGLSGRQGRARGEGPSDRLRPDVLAAVRGPDARGHLDGPRADGVVIAEVAGGEWTARSASRSVHHSSAGSRRPAKT